MENKRVLALRQQIKSLEQEIEDTKANSYFTCPNCEKKTKVKNVTLVARQHYVEPYSCSGGDYWTFQEWVIACPKCNNGIRSYDKKSELFRFIKEHEFNFKERLDWKVNPTTFLEGVPALDLDKLRKENAERQRRW